MRNKNKEKKEKRKVRIENNLDTVSSGNVQNSKTSNKENKKKNKILSSITTGKKARIIFTIIIILIIFLAIKTGIYISSWQNLAQDMIANTPSQVVDTDGNVIAELGNNKNTKNVSLSEIPDNLKNAYISIEDQRFYKHNGVDLPRTGAAILSYISNLGSSSFGGSSITQQLVKNLTGDNSSKVTRKVSEWIKAFALEGVLTKDEILEAYLNIIYVGPNIYGVELGAEYYFNKSVSDLSLAECAFLAGINNSPNSYNPFGDDDNTEKIVTRTETVLAKMLELEYITETEYSEAIQEVESGLKFKNGKIESASDSGDNIYSYHTDALITEIISDIADKKNISETFATNYIYMAGLTIYSTQVSSIQETIEDEFSKSKYILKSSNDSSVTSQAAMVIIDHETGYVVGCVGGLGEKTTSRGFNRATQAYRQTGSAGKPISVLLPAIDEGIITASSVYVDEPTTFDDGTEEGYSPTDYNDYRGEITVRQAVESSQNIPFVKIMEELTPKSSIAYMKKLGITTLTDADENLNLALGGLEKGISPLELAAAYATIANDGVYIEPTFYTKIENASGKTVVKSKQTKKRVFSKEVAYIVKSLLTEPVNGTEGTATYCKIDGIDVAAKTGTTNDEYDRWLCGFTPYYTAVTWFGFDQNETIKFNGKNPSGVIWSSVMKSIHSGLDNAEFEVPTSKKLVTLEICADSLEIANDGCTNTYTEYYISGTEPTSYCTTHKSSSTSKTTSSDSSSSQKNESSTDKTTSSANDDEQITNTSNEKETSSSVNTREQTTEKNTEQNTSSPSSSQPSTTTQENNTVANPNSTPSVPETSQRDDSPGTTSSGNNNQNTGSQEEESSGDSDNGDEDEGTEDDVVFEQ